MSLSAKSKKGRLEQLKTLRGILAKNIDKCESMRDLASLSKQYKETIKEIEDIEGVESVDEISKLLAEREADGKSNSVR